MLHKVIARTDVWLGDRDGESVWETVDSRIEMLSDESVDLILEACGEQREDVRVQQIVLPDGEGQMIVIEIHYGCKHDWVQTCHYEMACDNCGDLKVTL